MSENTTTKNENDKAGSCNTAGQYFILHGSKHDCRGENDDDADDGADVLVRHPLRRIHLRVEIPVGEAMCLFHLFLSPPKRVSFVGGWDDS